MSGQRHALDVGTRALMATSGSTLTFPRRSPLKIIRTSPFSVPSRTFSSSPAFILQGFHVKCRVAMLRIMAAAL